jgi:hypothetical protein
MKDEMTVTFSSTIPSLSVDTFSLLHYHTIVGMFHMYQSKGDRLYLFLHFCNYRQSIIPYTLLPLIYPKLLPLWSIPDGQTEGPNSSPLVP